MLKFVIFQDDSDAWRWRLWSAKDELMATSEPHSRKVFAIASLTATIKAVSAEKYELTFDQTRKNEHDAHAAKMWEDFERDENGIQKRIREGKTPEEWEKYVAQVREIIFEPYKDD